MKKKNGDSLEFDLTGTVDAVPDKENTAKINELKQKIVDLEKKTYQYERELRNHGVETDLLPTLTDEEYICVKGMETIKGLVMNQIQTKDDINMFDILYRNLLTIRGIKVDKKKNEKPKSRDELISIIKGGASK